MGQNCTEITAINLWSSFFDWLYDCFITRVKQCKKWGKSNFYQKSGSFKFQSCFMWSCVDKTVVMTMPFLWPKGFGSMLEFDVLLSHYSLDKLWEIFLIQIDPLWWVWRLSWLIMHLWSRGCGLPFFLLRVFKLPLL